MNSACRWPACNRPGTSRIDGQPFCSEHYRPKLLELVLEGMRSGIDEAGNCDAVLGWPNRLARLVTSDDALPTGALTKAKIERRAFDFAVDGKSVLFSIVRHPAARETFQRWRFTPDTGKIEVLEERVLKAEYPISDDGTGVCPTCGSGLDITPGRVRCTQCDFQIQHEHTLDPW